MHHECIIILVDSSHPPGVQAGKGSTVRRLKWYVSWVQYDVSQYSPYLLVGHIEYKEHLVSTKGPSGAHLWCICYAFQLTDNGTAE